MNPLGGFGGLYYKAWQDPNISISIMNLVGSTLTKTNVHLIKSVKA